MPRTRTLEPASQQRDRGRHPAQAGHPVDGAAASAGWPSFSVVIPTYQRRDLVCDAVRALASCDYPGELELIVVIDGSTDGTADALAAVECPFPMRIIAQENAGASQARNRGARAAAHEVILFLDDDMICQSDLIEEHGPLYCEGADAVIGNTPIDSASPPGFLPQSVSSWIESTRVQTPLSPFDIFTGQLSVRKTAFDEIGGFDARFTTGTAFGNEDADFGADLLARFDVRHNPLAISHQRYVVGLREYMERAPRAVEADLHLIRKRPELASELFDAKGLSRWTTRFVFRPLSSVPLLPKLLAELAIWTSEFALRTPFRSNRVLARFFSAARTLNYWSRLRAAGWYPSSQRPLVLCYHAVADHRDDPLLFQYSVPPALFAKQLDDLSMRGFSFISPRLFAEFLNSGAPLPRRPVLLTFDDGYRSMLSVARDVLVPRGIGALVFAVTGTNTNAWDQPFGAGNLDLLTATQLKELAALGVETGSHSRTHRELPQLARTEQAKEVRGSADDLIRAGLPRPRFFAYPYGSLDEASVRAVREAGFAGAFALAYRHVTAASDRYKLPRVIVLADDDGWRFRFKTGAPRLFGWFVRAKRLLRVAMQRAGLIHAG